MLKNLKCYFAECCVQIQDEEYFLQDSQLLKFQNELPYNDIIELCLTSGIPATAKSLETTFESDDVIIGTTSEGGWVFISSDTSFPCSIETNHDYSFLQGCVSNCSDKKIMHEKFMQLFRLAVECRMTYKNGISIHASYVCSNKQAVLFTAPSGTGKSTQAALWNKHLGADIISGDRPFIRTSQHHIHAYGVPWDGKEQIFLQENYPVKAIVEVRQSKSNYLREISSNQAFRLLTRQCFIPMWDDELKFNAIETIKKIAHSLPFYRLFCLPEVDAAHLLKDALFSGQNSLVKEVQTDMKIIDGFVIKNIVDEWIVMPIGTNIKNFEGAIVLNAVSAFIWEQLNSPISRDDLLKAVIDEFDADSQDVAADLDEFLEKLDDMCLLQKGSSEKRL